MGTRSGFGRPRAVYIEYLEKRIAPATFIVTNLNDAGPGSLRQAVIDANDNPGTDKIVFRGAATNGEIALTSGELDITDSVKINGPGAGRLIIDAQNLSRIFDINDGTNAVKKVTIKGLSMIEGTAGFGSGSPGGGIYTQESLILVNSVISGCEAPAGFGAGIFAYTSGKVVISNSKITANTAAIDGGGLWLRADSGIQVSNSLISGNTAASDGGGIYAKITPAGTGDILIDKSTITHNSGANGGGIWADNDRQAGGNTVGKITVRASFISSNSADQQGGGVFLNDGHVILDRNLIANNSAILSGGGISAVTLESLRIRNSELVNNQATGPGSFGGGGLFVDGESNVLIQRTLIVGNSSANGGGGIRTSLTGLTIQSTTISDNTTSAGPGGGLMLFGTPLVFHSSTLSGNTTSAFGGGLYASNSNVSLVNSTVRDNSAVFLGGGIFATTSTGNDLRIANSLVADNHSGEGGGGVSSTGDGGVEIANSRLLRNTSGLSGGGLYLSSNSAAISIVRSLIAENTAADAGGGMALNGVTSSFAINNTIIRDNVAASDVGGGVLLSGGILTFKKSSVIDNIAATTGGGIWIASPAFVVLNGSRVTGNTAPTDPQIYGPYTA